MKLVAYQEKKFSEQFFDLLLSLGNDWKIDDLNVDPQQEEVSVFFFANYIDSKAELLKQITN